MRVVERFVLELHVVGFHEGKRAVAELVEVASRDGSFLDGFDDFFAYAGLLQFLLRDGPVDDILEELAHVLVGGGRDVHDSVAARFDTALYVFFEQGEVVAFQFLLVVVGGYGAVLHALVCFVGEARDGAGLDQRDKLGDRLLFGDFGYRVGGVVFARFQECRDERVETCDFFGGLRRDEFCDIEPDEVTLHAEGISHGLRVGVGIRDEERRCRTCRVDNRVLGRNRAHVGTGNLHILLAGDSHHR